MEVLDSILAVVVNKSIPSSRKDLLYRPRDRDAFMPSDYVADKPKHKRKGRTRSSLDVFVQSIEMRSKIKSEGR